MFAQELDTFAHFAKELLDRSFSGEDVCVQLGWARDNVAAFAHCEVAEKRDYVSADVNQQHSAEADLVVRESNDRSSDEPASLYSGEQKSIGVDELVSRSQFLDERSDGGPEHPEAGSDQSVHGVQLPDLCSSGEGENGNCKDDNRASGVEHHDQSATILAVNDHACKREQKDCRKGLHHRQGPKGDCRMRGLQNVPGDRGGIHSAANHGNYVGSENETQPLLLQNRTHELG